MIRRLFRCFVELLPVAMFGLAILGVAGGMASYWLEGGIEWIGGLLAVSFVAGTIGFSLVARLNRAEKESEGEREPPHSAPEEWEAYDRSLKQGAEAIPRRRLLLLAIVGFFGSLAVTVISGLRSLGPNPAALLFDTPWKSGRRLVRDDGTPISADELNQGGFIVVFPEGHLHEVTSQAVLLRLPQAQLQLPPDRLAWTVHGLVAYSRVCTHAGCPVGQFEQAAFLLACPCHQSTFDALRGAVPTGGPAARALPQLPLAVDADGYLIARGGFPTAVGPGFWSTDQ